MKYCFSLPLLFFLFACSSESPAPETDQQEREEIVIGEENPINEQGENEEEFSFPLSFSVIFKNFSNPSLREGQFYSIDFINGSSLPNEPTNITQSLGLDLDAEIHNNGQENVLVFRQRFNLIDMEHITLNLDTGAVYSVKNSDLFQTDKNCFWYGNHLGATEDKFFAYNLDLCSEYEAVIPIVRSHSSNVNQILPTIDLAFLGDSPHRVWATKDYFFVHFSNLDKQIDPIGTVQDGLMVYDADTFALIYDTRTPVMKNILIDGHDLIIESRNPHQIELIDLVSGEQKFIQNVSNIDGLKTSSTIGNRAIGNGSVEGSKIGGIVVLAGEPNLLRPGIYDIETNSTIAINPNQYNDFFRDKGNPRPTLIRQPKEFLFDLGSNTIIILYNAFNEETTNSGIPDFTGLVFMNFEGKILNNYEFTREFLSPQIMVRR